MVGQPIGRGRSTVHRGEDRRLRRRVAIKEVRLAEGQEDAVRVRRRALREAQAAARLDNPHVVTVYDVVEEDGSIWLVMELVDAPSLAQMVADEGALPHDRAARIGLGVLSALQSAHAVGVVHRDVKPANVLVIDDDRAKLADFGVATIRDESRVTAVGSIIGSPAYMAPEQAMSAEVGPPADLWALGATLYFAVEGLAPFTGDSALATATAVVTGDHRPQQNRGSLTSLIDRLLDKDPGLRPDADYVVAVLTAAASPGPQPPTEPTLLADVGPITAATRPLSPAADGPSSDDAADADRATATAGALAPASDEPSDDDADVGGTTDVMTPDSPATDEPPPGSAALGEPDLGAGATAATSHLSPSTDEPAASPEEPSDPAAAARSPSPTSDEPPDPAPLDVADRSAATPTRSAGPTTDELLAWVDDADGDGGAAAAATGSDVPGGSARRPRQTAVVAALALMILVLAGVGVSLLLSDDESPEVTRSQDDRQQDAAAGGDEGSSTTAATETTAGPDATEPTAETTTTSSAASDAAGGDVPEGWVVYTNPAAGYTIAHPPGWQVESAGGPRIDIRDPATGSYLRIDWTATPRDDPVADWRQQSGTFASRHQGYQEIQIAPYSYRDYNAAMWEFRYQDGGAQLHAGNLGFVTGGRGYALLFQTREDLWSQSQDTYAAFRNSFSPA